MLCHSITALAHGNDRGKMRISCVPHSARGYMISNNMMKAMLLQAWQYCLNQSPSHANSNISLGQACLTKLCNCSSVEYFGYATILQLLHEVAHKLQALGLDGVAITLCCCIAACLVPKGHAPRWCATSVMKQILGISCTTQTAPSAPASNDCMSSDV